MQHQFCCFLQRRVISAAFCHEVVFLKSNHQQHAKYSDCRAEHAWLTCSVAIHSQGQHEACTPIAPRPVDALSAMYCSTALIVAVSVSSSAKICMCLMHVQGAALSTRQKDADAVTTRVGMSKHLCDAAYLLKTWKITSHQLLQSCHCIHGPDNSNSILWCPRCRDLQKQEL